MFCVYAMCDCRLLLPVLDRHWKRCLGSFFIEANGWPMPKDAADSSASVGITFWTVGGSVWEL